MPTILLKKSDTPGSVPGTANLTNLAGGVEVAVNTADKRVYSMTSASAVIELGTNPSSLTCSDVSATVLRAGSATITNLLATTLTVSGGTANGVLYLNGSKVATSGSALTFDGSYFTAASGTGTFLADIVQVSGTATKVNANGVGLEFRGGSTPNITSYSRVGSAYLPMTLDTSASIFSISGTEAMRITSSTLYTASGINVGIGTSSPASKFQVKVATNANAAFNDVSGVARLDFYNDAASANVDANIQFNNLFFRANGTIVSTIDSSGNLGIGTSSPTNYGATYKTLAVNGSSTGIVDVMQNGTVYGQLSTEANVYKVEAVGASTVLRLVTNGATRATLDSSGNLGLGVTPSAWGGNEQAFEIRSAGSAISGAFTKTGATNGVSLALNSYYNAGWKYVWSGGSFPAMRYEQDSGGHFWFTAPSGTAGNTITFTQAMTLDADGDLGIGTTSPGFKLDVQGTTPAIRLKTAGVGTGFKIEQSNATGDVELNVIDGYPLIFKTNNTERARITAGGYFKASNTGGYDNATGAYHELLNNDASDAVVLVTHFGATNPLGIGVAFTAASPDDNTQYFLRCADSTTARCFIYSDGDLANHDGVYGTISDERLKQDIVDAPSQWDDIKAVRFRKYRMKTDVETNPDAPALLGVVAQELEQTSPGLIDEHPNEDGTTTKTVKSSILLMKAAVALQEAMARIEKLEAEMALLKGA